MLRRLSLRDVVIVSRLEVELEAGFSVLTGETGAGKSILIDALQLALGGRGEAGVVREGCARAEVTAEFDTPPALHAWLDEAGFDAHAARSEVPLLVDFWAPWCAPCRAMAPAYAQAAGVLEPDVRLAKVNTEEAQSLAARFRIQSIPTMILFLHGRELARQSGAMPAQAIVQWARQHLPLSPG